jgi:hypothetical protein
MTDGDPGCPFCCPREGDILVEHSLGYARYDRYPVSPGHMLCIPFRHTDDWRFRRRSVSSCCGWSMRARQSWTPAFTRTATTSA